MRPTVLEICAGGGGQSLGLERAGFEHAAAIDIEPIACETLRLNRPAWHTIEADIREFEGTPYRGVDLLAGGVPCPPFSLAGKQYGAADERDLFPAALRLVEQVRPGVVLFENVRGLATARFASYRRELLHQLTRLGYQPEWRVLNASEFGVSQLRPRFVLIALKSPISSSVRWPIGACPPPSVGAALGDLMAAGGWSGAATWSALATSIAPTLVGGSKKHGGPDLGPTRARQQWALMGVDAVALADAPPTPAHPPNAAVRLTTRMAARLQGFPDDWQFAGKKTAQYRQIGNAFPPPVALAVGISIAAALVGAPRRTHIEQQLPLGSVR